VPRRVAIDERLLAAVLAPGRSVATHAALRSLGVPGSTISYRCRPGGPWQRLLPGVVAGHSGTPTTHERRLAAVAYAGAGVALTGFDALDEHGLPLTGITRGARVHVLVPHACQRQSAGFALVTRTERPITATTRRGLPVVGVARALVDATRRMSDLDQVRTLVARAVQQRRCTVSDLLAEVRAGPRQRTALVRRVLSEVRAGIRSSAEAKVRIVFQQHGVPEPRWNAEVRELDGDLLAVVDALWEDLLVVLEIDSLEWHLEPADYRATQARQRKLVAAGFTVLSVAPGDVLRDPEAFCRQVKDVLARARARRAA